MSETLPPIPSPPGHLAREFCHRGLPILVYLAAIAATALLWQQRFTGTQLFGEVEAVHANVASIHPGTLVRLDVDRFSMVTNGQIIGTIQVVDPETVQRELDVVRADLAVLRSRLSIDRARNDRDFEALHARWLDARVDLATARVRLENARREVQRAETLRADRILSTAEYELATSIRDALQVEATDRALQVEQLGHAVQRLQAEETQPEDHSLDVVGSAIAAQEARIRLMSTHDLVAPLDGMIRTVNRRVGERIASGEVVAVISSTRAEHIVGYVRQPLSLDPRPGMPCEIRTRGSKPQRVPSHILSVGADLELVASPLRLRGFDNSVERGLPFLVELPPGLDVHPGELVDLIVHPTDL